MGKSVPELRFKEFTGEWEVKKLGEITEISSGKCNGKDNVRVVDLEHIIPEMGSINGFTYSSLSTSSKNKFKAGEVLFGKLRPYLRKYWLAEFDGGCTTEIWVMRGKEITNEFLYRIVQTDKFIDLSNNTSGTKMPRADWKYMKEWGFGYPSLREQSKITDFLSTIDSRINNQSAKIDSFTDLKKGIMQKIFSQEIRFKREDGGEYPDWEEKALGNIAKIIKSSGLSKSDLDTSGEPCILYGELYTKYSEIIKVVLSKTEKKTNSLIKSRYGDVIIPSSGETPEDIATASCVLEDGVLFGGDLNIIRSSDFDGRFLSYQLNHHKRFDIAALAQGATVSHLYGKSLAKLLVVTANIEEQKKIADFLSTLDSKIDIETQIISTLKTLKKGLLQQMFV